MTRGKIHGSSIRKPLTLWYCAVKEWEGVRIQEGRCSCDWGVSVYYFSCIV